jgi:aerobic carbon-monoxide dehydrogenase medium subunit
VKPASFAYRAPSSVAEAVSELAEAGSEAAVLAGGQSLMIDLHYRRQRPALVIDINGVSELGRLSVADGQVEIGALVRHRQLEDAHLGDPLERLLRLAAAYVAHPPIRARGTFAGSIAWAHPAAEWCALAAAMDAEMVLASSAGLRAVPVAEWFTGRHQTSRHPDELVTAVRLPLLGAGTGAGTGVGFAEHRRTRGSFALAAALTAVQLADGRVSWARIGLSGAADVPLRAHAAEAVLTGQAVSEDLVAEAAQAAASAARPVPEPGCSPAYRRQALRVMVRRSLQQALAGGVS